MLDLICAYSIYTVYFICRDSLGWLAGVLKPAREISFRSERKYVEQHAVRARKATANGSPRAPKYGGGGEASHSRPAAVVRACGSPSSGLIPRIMSNVSGPQHR